MIPHLMPLLNSGDVNVVAEAALLLGRLAHAWKRSGASKQP
jgi:hypothetical protein